MRAISTISLAALFLAASVAIPQKTEKRPSSPTASLQDILKRLITLEGKVHSLGTRVRMLEDSIPTAKAPKTLDGKGHPAPKPAPASSIITVKVSNKRFQEMDLLRGIASSSILFDISYTSSFNKPTRTFKGIIKFCDLFGETKLQLNDTVTTILSPGKTITRTGIGFDFNQFMGPHRWVRITSLNDMTIKYTVTAVIYTDGTKEVFPH